MKMQRGIVGRSNLPLYQYDYGQKLILTGIELPVSYEVHFSNTENGASKTSIGDSTGVMIPDEYLTSGEPVYVWVFLHTGNNDGETEYKGVIYVYKRSRPSDTPPTPEQQSVITQTIAALNKAVAQADADVEHYPKIVDGYWYFWDEEQQQWVSSGEKAQGENGETGEKGDKGDKGDKGEKGDKGDPGDLSSSDIATVEQTQAIINEYEG